VIPAWVDVLSHRYSIQTNDETMLVAGDPNSFDALGHCQRDMLTITVRGNLPGDKLREVLLHEVLHAIVGSSRMALWESDEEERIVAQLSPVLLNVLRTNPDLARFLLADQE
jgi:hypothetical protein